VYETFSNLNIRFDNLVNDPRLSITINISLISKSTFQHYFTDIIIPNQHRIVSFHLSNPIIIDRDFSSSSIFSKFTQLQNLVLRNIKPDSLKTILIHLLSLPCLSSLVIDCIGTIPNRDAIYRQIFRLPVLKYCEVSLPDYHKSKPLPIATTDFSPIEYFVITDQLELNEMNSLLSYVPQLRRLSVYLSSLDEKSIRPYTTVLNHLTHIAFNIERVSFDKFRLYTKDLFRCVQVLYISIENSDAVHQDADQRREFIVYYDANRWKEFIVSDIPNLRIFDITIYNYGYDEDFAEYFSIIDRFNSSFWFERQWFFEYQVHEDSFGTNHLMFYSINPYRYR
jgi:hypothetical protein